MLKRGDPDIRRKAAAELGVFRKEVIDLKTRDQSGFLADLDVGQLNSADLHTFFEFKAGRATVDDLQSEMRLIAAVPEAVHSRKLINYLLYELQERTKKKKKLKRAGFTLIELLVVVAIIGLLASVVMVSLNSTRAKGRDARKKADFKSISTALYLFYDSYGRMPNNYRPGYGVCDTSPLYDQSMQELVDAGFLGIIPKSPGGERYCYYDYGPGGDIGALIVTELEDAPSTTTGIPPSCRPWAAGLNWCSMASSKQYCICNPY